MKKQPAPARPMPNHEKSPKPCLFRAVRTLTRLEVQRDAVQVCGIRAAVRQAFRYDVFVVLRIDAEVVIVDNPQRFAMVGNPHAFKFLVREIHLFLYVHHQRFAYGVDACGFQLFPRVLFQRFAVDQQAVVAVVFVGNVGGAAQINQVNMFDGGAVVFVYQEAVFVNRADFGVFPIIAALAVQVLFALAGFQIKRQNTHQRFVAHKSVGGEELLALELPGLWNGAMHDWNTLFVEVPLETFNPVKEVNDLLRSEHQSRG